MPEYDVLIVDDDVMQANALAEVLSALGFTSRVLPDGARVVEESKRSKPRLIVLDIIMPGIDGLSLCMKLKPEVSAWGGHIVVASGKDRAAEEPRAKKAGAEFFIPKPYRVKDLKAALTELLGPAGPKAPQAAGVPDLALKIWGSRGEGGKTPCVSLGLATGEVFIFDGGSGLSDCGTALVQNRSKSAVLLLTHYHPAHIEGLKDCPVLKEPGFDLRIAGPMDPDVNLSELCRGLGAAAKVSSFFVEEKEYKFGDQALMGSTYTNHPTTTLAYSLRILGRKIVYCADAELPAEDEVDVGNNFERLRQFASGADVLFMDAACLPEERGAPWAKGHSSWKEAVRLAAQAGVRRLCLFHANAAYTEQALQAAENAAKEAAAEAMSSLDCFMAKDGAVVML